MACAVHVYAAGRWNVMTMGNRRLDPPCHPTVRESVRARFARRVNWEL